MKIFAFGFCAAIAAVSIAHADPADRAKYRPLMDALAKKHDCALLAPSYEQPQAADCQMWCDPRNGSSAAFQKCDRFSGITDAFINND